MRVTLMEYPNDRDWMEVKRRALITVGLNPVSSPSLEWKRKILYARHSPIRYLRFSFLIEDLPSWVAVHLARHVHAQPYVRSQRNDRQNMYDRNTAPQNTPVSMIYDVNGEEIMTIANKRLCKLASPETQEVVQKMCDAVIEVCPEYDFLLVPMGVQQRACHEMNSCGWYYDQGL